MNTFRFENAWQRLHCNESSITNRKINHYQRSSPFRGRFGLFRKTLRILDPGISGQKQPRVPEVQKVRTPTEIVHFDPKPLDPKFHTILRMPDFGL